MSTLAAGANVTGSFVAADSLSVDPKGNTYQFESPTGTVLYIGNGTRTFGPFNGQTWKITNTGGAATIYYETSDGPGEIATSRSLTSADDGLTLKVTATLNVTVPLALTPAGKFGVVLMADSGTTVSIVSSGGTLLNGATTTITRAGPQMFAVVADPAVANAYFVSGS